MRALLIGFKYLAIIWCGGFALLAAVLLLGGLIIMGSAGADAVDWALWVQTGADGCLMGLICHYLLNWRP